MDISKKNITRNIIAICLHSLAVLCCSGPILQAFLVGWDLPLGSEDRH